MNIKSINRENLPKYNFGIVVRKKDDCQKIGEIAKWYYPDYKKNANFNATNNHIYYVTQKNGENMWNHSSEGNHPAEVTEIFTLEEFTKKYLTEPVIIDNYQIY